MKIGRSLTDLAQEIERQADAKRDFIVDTRQARMQDDGQTLTIENTGDFPIQDLALTQIGERVGVPTKYLRRMQAEAPALLAQNVNHWFEHKPERRMVRTLDNRARAFLSDRYMRVDNFDVASTVLPVLFQTKGLRILSTEVTEHRLYIKAASTEVVGEIKSRRVGDMVEAGVMITNSEVGLGAIKVTPFAHFLVCTNGMTREGGKRWNHVGRAADFGDDVQELLTDETKQAEDKALLLKVRDTMAAALDQNVFNAWLEKLQGATSEKIEGDPVKAIEVLSNKLSFGQTEKSSVLRHLIEGGDLSRYGLINAVTRTAEDLDDYTRASDFEAAGGTILHLAPSEWREVAMAA